MSSPRKKTKASGAAPRTGGAAGSVASEAAVPKPVASLRLAIGRAGIAIELDDDVAFGPARLVDLSIRLPGLPFPIDVSGGVDRFRHRRGQLARLDLDAERLAPHLSRALRGVVSAEAPEVWIAVERWGARVALRSPAAPLARGPRPVLAFDVAIDPSERGVRLHVLRARGLDLPSPARQLALRAVAAATHRLAAREGGRFALETLPEIVAEQLLPDLGVRMPAIDPMQFAWFATAHRAGSLVASRDPAPELDEHVLRARELHELLARVDEPLATDDLPRARASLLDALEIAPHEPALLHLLADLDRHAGGRAEAALSTLARSPRAARPNDGGLAGALHEETGDIPAALATYTLTAERDDCSWLGAACFAKAAALCEQPFDALEWLDRAIVRDPSDAALHGSRVRVAFAAGRPGEARSSVEHLDAMLTGAESKYAVWVSAGQAASERGFGGEAIALFERALARVPDDPRALAGLGTTMLQERRIARGVALLHQALERAEATGAPTSPIALALAKALADGLDNLPGAIARVRRIPSSAEEAIEARLLEGRWRAALGDILGAGVAFAHFRELARTRIAPDSRIRGDLVAAGLLEAARFERHQHHDILAAHAHASIGLELRPTDQALRAFYRHVAAELAFPTGATSASPALGDEREPVARRAAQGESFVSESRESESLSGPSPLAPRLEPESSSPPSIVPRTLPPAGSSDDFEPLASRLEPRPSREDGADAHEDGSPPTPPAPGVEGIEALESFGRALDLSLDDGEPVDADLEQRAADLTQRLQLDPTDDTIADELIDVLTTLGRGHELLALLLARLEDAPDERKPALRERTHAALVDLAARADEAGRPDEAALFRMTAEAL
jgi:tetratricopeptide (TPR) repeat protein